MAAYGSYVYSNNSDVAAPSRQDYAKAWNSSVEWAVNNEAEILKQNNVFLWYFLDKSAKLTHDPRLRKLVEKYRWKHRGDDRIWKRLFQAEAYVPFDVMRNLGASKYHLLFMLGITCDETLESMPVIQEQLNPNFCRWAPIISSCTTHQLMGFHFMQSRQCDDGADLTTLSRDLQDQIVDQLIWDPRVGDVYIQRVLMLELTGAGDKVKPVWLRQILDAQHSDGAWESFYPIIPSKGKSARFGFSYKAVAVRSYKPSFHMTAQGIYLLSLKVSGKTSDAWD